MLRYASVTRTRVSDAYVDGSVYNHENESVFDLDEIVGDDTVDGYVYEFDLDESVLEKDLLQDFGLEKVVRHDSDLDPDADEAVCDVYLDRLFEKIKFTGSGGEVLHTGRESLEKESDFDELDF